MTMFKLLLGALIALCVGQPATAQQSHRETIVLVHGAFAESSSWKEVISRLDRDGYRVVAAANPLRSLKDDAESVAALVRSIDGPVVLVGHSYGGPVISMAAERVDNVKALVFVSAFAPDVGESALTLSAKFPGSTLGSALMPVPLPNGGTDLYIDPAKFRAQFAADVPVAHAAAMATTQRPVTKEALEEPAGSIAWRRLPTWMIYGSEDRNIPPAVMAFMAKRMDARATIAIPGASHALMVSHPGAVVAMIEAAASAR